MAESSSRVQRHRAVPQKSLRCLNTQLIERIDDAACRVGQFGEVRLVIVKGELRFIQITVSEMIGEQRRGDEDD